MTTEEKRKGNDVLTVFVVELAVVERSHALNSSMVVRRCASNAEARIAARQHVADRCEQGWVVDIFTE